MKRRAAKVPITAVTLLLAGGLLWASIATGQELDYEQLWSQGIAFDEFLAGADQRVEDWQAHYRDSAPEDEALARAAAVDATGLRLLVVAEDWCGDSVNTIPYVASLVERIPSLELRLIDSSAGDGVMAAHRTPDQRTATPTVVLLDADGNEVGAWVERPSNLQEWFLANRDSLQRRELTDHIHAWYAEDRGRSTVGEILDLLSGIPAQAAQEIQAEPVETPLISASALIDRVARGDELTILDVRTVEEFAEGHVPGAINIPHTEVADRLAEIAAMGDTEIVLYCRSGRRAGVAADVLRAAGYERLLHLDGDMLGWEADQLPIEREPGS